MLKGDFTMILWSRVLHPKLPFGLDALGFQRLFDDVYPSKEQNIVFTKDVEQRQQQIMS